MQAVDINCDLGEGMSNDAQIMPYISSCNIACGGHYGDKSSISETIKLALKYKVNIGAHPSFPDKENFGRKIMDISESDLYESLCQQILIFSQICKEEGARLHHVKLHGALYNLAAKDPITAKIVVKSLNATCSGARIYTPYQSELARLAKSNFKVIYEAFADRRYHSNLQLVSRDRDDAVITDLDDAWKHLYNMLENGKVKTVEGESISIKADTFCVHGDQPEAVNLVQYIAKKL